MAPRLRSSARRALSNLLASLPSFAGKGRVTLLADRVLTDYDDPGSYQVLGSLNDGVVFAFDLRPWGQKFAYYYQAWELDYVRALRQLYQGGTFIDVGSSLGLYVVCLGGRIRQRSGDILSIEPVPFNMERQQQNVDLNGLADLVHFVPAALSNARGHVRLAADPKRADNNAFVCTTGQYEVQTLTLDELMDSRRTQRVGLIKLDVEGFEPLVLEGGRRTLETDRPVIFAEFCRERMELNGLSMDGSWKLLVETLGYRPFRWFDRWGRLTPIDAPDDYENLFFIPHHVVVPPTLRS